MFLSPTVIDLSLWYLTSDITIRHDNIKMWPDNRSTNQLKTYLKKSFQHIYLLASPLFYVQQKHTHFTRRNLYVFVRPLCRLVRIWQNMMTIRWQIWSVSMFWSGMWEFNIKIWQCIIKIWLVDITIWKDRTMPPYVQRFLLMCHIACKSSNMSSIAKK